MRDLLNFNYYIFVGQILKNQNKLNNYKNNNDKRWEQNTASGNIMIFKFSILRINKKYLVSGFYKFTINSLFLFKRF